MKQLKSIVVFCLLSVSGFQAATQDINKLETPYEKARAALADSAVAAIMRNDIQLTLQIGLAMNNMKENEWSEWKQLEFMEQVIATAWGAYQWGEPETYSDLRAFQRIGPACEEYARKRDALEKTKTPLDIEREERRNYVPPAGALSTVLLKTREGFSKLMKKGEYEKKAQFRQRIAETGLEMFDSIAYTYCWQYALVSARNGQMNYDVENELDSLCLWHSENNKMLATCHMSPEMAQRVSKEKKNFLVETMKVCVVNGEVLPYKIAMATDAEQWMYEFHPLAKNTVMDTNIVFSVAKTGITDTNILQVMGDHVFDYNEYRNLQIKKEQERIAKEKARKAQEELEERLARQLYDEFSVAGPGCDFIDERLNNNSELEQKVYASFFLDYEEAAGCTITEICNRINAIHSQCGWMSDAREYVKKNQLTGMDVGKVIYQKHIFYKHLESLEYIDDFLVSMSYCYETGSFQNSYLFSLKKYKNNPALVSRVIHFKESGYSNVYRTVAEWVVENDKKASKEWEKRKDKYKDIVEFYEHYISEDYKPRK